ncbi:MAG: hypothetical protein M0P70_00555 [Desulfobulbaceae bacterium]|nr:hypothetical protein [Desulfobulbaceae bacterium]
MNDRQTGPAAAVIFPAQREPGKVSFKGNPAELLFAVLPEYGNDFPKNLI